MDDDATAPDWEHVSQTIMRADLGPDASVNRFGGSMEVHLKVRTSEGHWLATLVVRAAESPIEIRTPGFVFVPRSHLRYAEPGTLEREPPPAIVERAGATRARLVAMRDDGLLMSPRQVRELVGAFRDLVTDLREGGFPDHSGKGARAAALLALLDPSRPDGLVPATSGPGA